ncbi:hypothetical protein QJQ45_030288, partial [Haematococcus lacustris]
GLELDHGLLRCVGERMLACSYGMLAPRTMRRGPQRTACRAVNFENELFARQLQGKSFLCTQCGKCCTGEGEVWVSSEELLRISEHLHLTPQAFQRRYTEKHSGCKGWHLLLTKGEEQVILKRSASIMRTQLSC